MALGIDLDRITEGQDRQLQAAGCDAPPDRDEYRLLCSSVSHRKRSQNGGFQPKAVSADPYDVIFCSVDVFGDWYGVVRVFCQTPERPSVIAGRGHRIVSDRRLARKRGGQRDDPLHLALQIFRT